MLRSQACRHSAHLLVWRAAVRAAPQALALGVTVRLRRQARRQREGGVPVDVLHWTRHHEMRRQLREMSTPCRPFPTEEIMPEQAAPEKMLLVDNCTVCSMILHAA